MICVEYFEDTYMQFLFVLREGLKGYLYKQ